MYLIHLVRSQQQYNLMAFELALKFSLTKLYSKCYGFIQRNINIIVSSASFFRCNRVVIADILRWNHEFVVLQACMKWAEKKDETYRSNPKNIRKVFGSTWKAINFSKLTVDEFIKFEKDYPVFSFDEYKTIMDSIQSKQTIQKVRRTQQFTKTVRTPNGKTYKYSYKTSETVLN